jgi:hypothetical protein
MLKPTQRLETRVQTAQSLYWDETLTRSEKNPYPLAPPDKVMEGVVNEESYAAQNDSLGEASSQVMIPEFIQMTQEPGFEDGPRGIEFLGGGLLRDLKKVLVDRIITLFSPVCITDNSAVAHANIEAFLEEKKLPFVSPCFMEVEDAWKNGMIMDENTLVYYGGQFIQNQGPQAKNRMMKHFGRFLKIPTPDGSLCRRVYLLHPRGEDNPPDQVKWRNTKPYFDHELRVPIEKGFGGPVRMEILAQHKYFHQTYSFIRFSAYESTPCKGRF